MFYVDILLLVFVKKISFLENVWLKVVKSYGCTYKIILLGESVVENELGRNWILKNLYQTGA